MNEDNQQDTGKKSLIEPEDAGSDPELDALHGEGTQAAIANESIRRNDEFIDKQLEGTANNTTEPTAEELDEIAQKERQVEADAQVINRITTINMIAEKLEEPSPLTGEETLDDLAKIQEEMMKRWRAKRDTPTE